MVVMGWMIFRMTALAQETSGQSPLPAPTGPYSVGRTHFDWIDQSRPDPDSPSKHREIVVWVWYPASPKPGLESAQWMPGKWGELFWPEYVAKKLAKETLAEAAEKVKEHPISAIRTHSYTDAPIASALKKYPVLLFEPGLGDLPLMYATLIEDLVSHGYIVAGAIPTYYTQFTVFSDDRAVVAQKTSPSPPPGSEKRTSESQKAFPSPAGPTIYLTPEQERAFKNQREQLRVSIFHVWTGDMIFTLNQLEKLDADARSQFKGRLDLKHTGAFGHSFGGGASFQAAKDDARVVAALDLDGTLLGDVADGGLLKPLLLFVHPFAGWQTYAPSVIQGGKPGYEIALAGSTHYFSSDLGLMPFLPQTVKAQMGSIDPTRALTITKAYVEAFFGEYLTGKKSSLWDGPSPEYPEITFGTAK